MASRDEEELKGVRGGGGDRGHAVGEEGVHVLDNGAMAQIEDNFDPGLPVDVEEDPFIHQVVDDDGLPGWRPAVEASHDFENNQPNPDETLADDFEDRLDEHEQAKQEVLGGDSDLAVLARRDSIRREKATARAPFRRINPESSYGGLLGGQQTVAPGQDPPMVCRWEGEDVEACPVTVAWQPLDPVSSTPPRAFVRIQWGTRDGKNSVDIDVGTGGQVTIDASVVYVFLGLDPTSAPGQSFRLTANIGFYTCERETFVTKTEYLDTQANGAGGLTSLRRPNFAAAVLFDRDTPASPYDLNFNSAVGLLYKRTILANTYVDDPIQLANDVSFVAVQNGGGAPATSRLMWVLNL